MPSRSLLPLTLVRPAVPPLLPVLVPLVVAAIVFSVLFAWWFPGPTASPAGPEVRFTDVTAAAGITFIHRHGGGHSPTTLGGGVAVLDYNADGWPDLFFVNGAPWPWSNNAWQTPGTSSLYQNNGDGTFSEVTTGAGLDLIINGMAAVAADFDADGWPDLYVTAIGPNRLLRNRGDGTFEDVTTAAGVGGDENTWSTGAVWLDEDHDGDLDLIVAHYARWPIEVGLASAFSIAQVGRSYGAPVGFIGAAPTVYHNLGGGRFAPARDAAGLRNPDSSTGFPTGKALAIETLDANADGILDLRFTYHTAPDAWFAGQPEGGFLSWTPSIEPRREGDSAGLLSTGALSAATRDDPTELASLLSPAGETADRLNLSIKGGAVLLDYDNDGWTDRFGGGGLAESATNVFPDPIDFTAPPELRWRQADQWVVAPSETEWSARLTARGVATLDYDNDGDLDIVIAQNAGPARLLRNDQRANLPWLRLRLIATRTHPGAGGARVELHTPRRVFVRTVAPKTGYLAQSEEGLWFGLGEDTRVRRLIIRWPSGQRQELRPDTFNTTLTIREPSG